MSKSEFCVPTHVGPSKLDKVLTYCIDLCEESKIKVCLLTDIAKIMKLLEYPPLSPRNFYIMYDQPIPMLDGVQHSLQVEWNTKQMYSNIQGADF